MRFLRWVTRTVFNSLVLPSSPTHRYRFTVPGFSGSQGLSIGPPKFAASNDGW